MLRPDDWGVGRVTVGWNWKVLSLLALRQVVVWWEWLQGLMEEKDLEIEPRLSGKACGGPSAVSATERQLASSQAVFAIWIYSISLCLWGSLCPEAGRDLPKVTLLFIDKADSNLKLDVNSRGNKGQNRHIFIPSRGLSVQNCCWNLCCTLMLFWAWFGNLRRKTGVLQMCANNKHAHYVQDRLIAHASGQVAKCNYSAWNEQCFTLSCLWEIQC